MVNGGPFIWWGSGISWGAGKRIRCLVESIGVLGEVGGKGMHVATERGVGGKVDVLKVMGVTK